MIGIIYFTPISIPEKKEFGEYAGMLVLAEYRRTGDKEICLINGEKPNPDIERYVTEILSRQVSQDIEE